MKKESLSSIFFKRQTSVEQRGKLIDSIHNMGKSELQKALIMAVEEAMLYDDLASIVKSNVEDDDSGHIKMAIGLLTKDNSTKSEEELIIIRDKASAELKNLLGHLDELRFEHGNISGL